MRKDLAKCTTEQERSGSRYGAKKYGGRIKVHPDPDHDYLSEYGGYRPAGRHRQKDWKNLTDVLNPLRGAIRKNLGRPWNDVFSEFCEVLDRRSVAGFHIWTHLMQEVETKTYVGQDGKIYEKPTRYSYGSSEVSGFYVHPDTGILCYKERTSKAEARKIWMAKDKKESPEFAVPGDEVWRYKQFDGIWFRYQAKKIETCYGTVSYEIVKRQCNKKEVAMIRTWL